jgi:cytochrome P450 family 4
MSQAPIYSVISLQGFKTSVVGMVTTLYLLAANPKQQELVHEELDRVFGEDKTRDLTWDDLNELKYLEMCIKEALRIFPPIAQILRETTKDVKLGAN